MPVDDRNRLDLHRKLEAVLGHDDADTLMAHLPPVTWQEVATKDDVRGSEAALRVSIDAAIERLGIELRAEKQALRSDLRAEFIDAMNRQIKWLVGFAAVWTTVLVTAVRLIG